MPNRRSAQGAHAKEEVAGSILRHNVTLRMFQEIAFDC
jgi:hypothetical protein